MQRTYIIFGIGIILLALLVVGVYRASERPALPYASPLSDPIVAVNDTPIESESQAEFVASHYRIGDTVRVRFTNAGTEYVILDSYYDLRYSLIQTFTSLVFALLGLFIVRKRKSDPLSRKFLLLTYSLAALVAHTTGSFSLPTPAIAVALEILFHIAYALSGVLFLQFVLTFGRYSGKERKSLEIVLLSIGFLLGAITSVYFVQAHGNSPSAFHSYDTWLKLTRIYFGSVFLTALGVLVHAIRTRQDASLNKQLRWVLYGCTLSILSYILLWQLPMILDANVVISEEVMLLLAIIAPISIAIGIVRHKLFDIDLLIRKSISYVLLVVVVIGVYVLAVTGATWIAQQANDTSSLYPAAAAAILAALLFEPLRRKIFALVDRKFFRTSYDLREAQRQFLEDIRQALDPRMLGTLVVERMQQLIPVERIGFFTLNADVRRLRLTAHEGFGILERHGVTFTPEDLKTGLEYPVALPEAVEEMTIEVADRPMFERWKIALVVPMLKEKHRPLGFLVLGKRRSDTRFTPDDIELLREVASQTAIVLDRLMLQQQLLIEQAESQRLDELSRLKSYFVSSVTHDLKTPLTSIRLYAELLRSPLPEDKRIAYLTTIESETDRLARLITNVLDFARIEQGTKVYALRHTDLAQIVNDSVELLRQYIEAEGFSLSVALSNRPVPILADRDAITALIINLLSNAVKYVDDRKCIAVEVSRTADAAQLVLRDQGIGMDTDVLEHIFEPFYRVTQQSGSGAGLGLAIVKHTIDAHHATIGVASTPREGTTFTITFPVYETHSDH